jgi:hypothetical protein
MPAAQYGELPLLQRSIKYVIFARETYFLLYHSGVTGARDKALPPGPRSAPPRRCRCGRMRFPPAGRRQHRRVRAVGGAAGRSPG